MNKKADFLTFLIIIIAIIFFCLTIVILFKPGILIPINKTASTTTNATTPSLTPTSANESNRTSENETSFVGDFKVTDSLIYAGYKTKYNQFICEKEKYLFFDVNSTSNINGSGPPVKVFIGEERIYRSSLGKMTSSDCNVNASLNEGNFTACVNIGYVNIKNEKISLKLDPDNIYPETNEYNNILSKFVLNITQPDLSPAEKTEDRFKYTITSQEYKVAFQTDNYGEECVENAELKILVDNITQAKTLSAHHCARKEKNIYCLGIINEGIIEGMHNITIKIDPNNKIQESNESNNDYSLIYNVTAS